MRSILIVEDKDDVSEVLKAQMEALGLRVVVAKSESEALNAFYKDPTICIAAFDGVIEGGNSLPIIRRLRVKQFEGPRIAMAADFPMRMSQRQAGCNYHVDDKMALKELVKQLLEEGKVPEPAD